MKGNFIKTTDKDTANKLLSCGFQMISESNGVFTFVNCPALSFSADVNVSKISYTNLYTAS